MPEDENTTNDLASLRAEFQDVLASDPVDYDRVIELSNQLIRYDPDHVRFSVDAAHIARLGRELVSRQETAVSELVKNAYDADASWVELTFRNADYPGGSLSIIDDGTGMTRALLIDGFMRLSSQDKVYHPTSLLYRRQRAGRKGIGRFAAQRLGSRLTVITRTREAETALRVDINWEDFHSGLDLGKVTSSINEVEKKRPNGTGLIISGLSDSWTEASINRIYRYLEDLIQPFPLSKDTEERGGDPGFEIRLYRQVGDQKYKVADVESMVYDHALAEIDAWVDENGLGFCSIKSGPLTLEDTNLEIGRTPNEPKQAFEQLRNIKLKAYYFIYNSKESNFLPRNQNHFIRRLADMRGGIRLYRNGFRVLPYGEPLNDWLELDASSARRLILPPHSNINFFGFVEVRDTKGELFEETSSREGLIQNDAYHELVDFTYRVLRSVALRVASARERKSFAGQKNWTRTVVDPADKVRQTAQLLEDAAAALRGENGPPSPTSNDTETNNGQSGSATTADVLQSLSGGLVEAAQQQQEQQAALLEELGLLRVLASLGLSIGEFVHEVITVLPVLTAEATYFRHLHMVEGEPHHRAEMLARHITTLRNFTAYFGRAIQDNVRRETRPQELGVVLRTFQDTIAPAAKRYGITIEEADIRGLDLFSCPMHPSEWVSILMNFFTNSKKAIDRTTLGKGQILLSAGRESGNIYIEFADTGDGILPENEDRIFDAFFTTTSPMGNLAEESQEAHGTGLGLKIVKDIISAYNGTVRVVAPPSDFRTCFRVEVREATEEELAQYGY